MYKTKNGPKTSNPSWGGTLALGSSQSSTQTCTWTRSRHRSMMCCRRPPPPPPPPGMDDTKMSVEAGDVPSAKLTQQEEAALVKWIDPRRASSSSIGTRTMNYTFTTKNSKEFTSNRRYREDMRRHERVKFDPKDKFSLMMTQSMEYGWRARDPALYIKDPEMFHPRMKSRETAYSEALILGPRHP
mmetsp:Transcript_25596/g.49960  ORF Transcript_25596/g.49960 Transcript_25596/m.49960 type:complete len:186 (+) Transcript_25596:408-965(+)